MPTDTYEVALRYSLDDRAATAALHGIGNAADKAAHGVQGLHGVLGHLGAALGAHFLFHEGKKAFIDFNAEVENMKISLGAIIEMNFPVSLNQASDGANRLFNEFQRFSKLTPVTTREMMEFGTGVSAAVFGAGGKMKDFINVTEQGVVASKVFGAESKYAALEITEMLQGNVSKRMRFQQQILAASGMSEEQFKALGADKRLEAVEKALNSPAMKDATKRFSQSFAGVTSTLKDNIEIALGRVGLPLFKAVTAEVQKWNMWIEKHPAEIEAFATKASHVLTSAFATMREELTYAFSILKTIAQFIVAHKDVFSIAAQSFMTGRAMGSGMAGGGGTGAVAALRNVMMSVAMTHMHVLDDASGKIAEVSSGIAGAMAALPGKFGQLGGSLTMAIGFIESYFAQKNREIQDKQDQIVAGQYGVFGSQMSHDAAWNALAIGGPDTYGLQKRQRDADFYLLRQAYTGGAIRDGKIDDVMLHSLVQKDKSLNGSDQGLIVQMTKKAMEEAGVSGDLELRYTWLNYLRDREKAGETKDPLDGAPNTKPGDIIIQRVEVASEDPDRFVHGLVQLGERTRRSRTQADKQLRGGF